MPGIGSAPLALQSFSVAASGEAWEQSEEYKTETLAKLQVQQWPVSIQLCLGRMTSSASGASNNGSSGWLVRDSALVRFPQSCLIGRIVRIA
jgi:hypothetical protein